MNEETAGGSKQNKRNTRSKSKIKNLSLQKQVTPIKVMAGVDKQELLELIRSIMKEEIAVALTTLQPQLNSLKVQMEECGRKFG